MVETLIVSNVLLWALVLVLSAAVFALARQVGVLNERVAPAGALMPTSGPRVGETVESIPVTDLDRNALVIGGPTALPTLLMWVSPTCPVCRELVPTARRLAATENLRLVFASDGDTEEQHRKYASEMGIDDYPYVISQPLGITFGVSKLPFAAIIDEAGVLASKGLVNTREHLDSLVEATHSEHKTIQEYVSQDGFSVEGFEERA